VKTLRVVIAWVFLIGGLIGFTLSAFQVIAKDEPLIVLLLSWAALIYEGFNAVVLTSDSDK
jgi:hypothetical protein